MSFLPSSKLSGVGLRKKRPGKTGERNWKTEEGKFLPLTLLFLTAFPSKPVASFSSPQQIERLHPPISRLDFKIRFSKWHPYLLQSVTLTIQSLRSVYRLLQREPAFGAQIRLLVVKNSNFELGNKGDFPLGSCGRIYLLRLEESQIKPKLSW